MGFLIQSELTSIEIVVLWNHSSGMIHASSFVSSFHEASYGRVFELVVGLLRSDRETAGCKLQSVVEIACSDIPQGRVPLVSANSSATLLISGILRGQNHLSRIKKWYHA